jgi:signal transduction histidine kinase/ligand-binding sensor domain-containing protein/CheY-like chemotaxis protein
MGFKIRASFILLLCAHSALLAQNSQYKFSHLDITNGLSDNHINCMFKDQQGYMWFGTTSGGLSRYDGYQFRIFRHDARDSSSLGENYVMNINQGPEGMLWIFTKSGISVYNPATERFSNNITAFLARYKILAGQISEIKKDKAGNFWFLAKNQGLYFYDPAKHFTEFCCGQPGSRVQLHSNYITDIAPDQRNNVWLIYDDGTIDELNAATGWLISRYDAVAKANSFKQQTYNLLVDDQQTLWVYSSARPMGVYCYNVAKNTCAFYNKDTQGSKLTSNIINTIVQADGNKMWFGTDHGGIDVFDRVTHKMTYLETKADDATSLSGDCVNLYKDDADIIWVGTFKQGINYYHSSIIQFPLMKHFITDKNSQPYDERHNLWIGTNGGGLLYYDRAKNTYKQFRHDANDPNSLSNDVIIHLFIDHEHKLWIGTYFGGMDCFDGKKFIHYRHNDYVPGSISDDRVYTITEDAQKNLWVGTFAGGLNIYDRATNTFRHPKYPMSSEYTSIICQDKQGNMWIGRDKGIDVILKKTNTLRHYSYISGNPNSLADNDVNIIMQDSRGLMWIGTKDGLSIIDGQTGKFINVEKNIGLPATNVSNIIEDNGGVMWLSTTNGLASIRLTGSANGYTCQVNRYNEFDGLQGREFNIYASFKTREGELAFGGPHGFNLFEPEKVSVFKPKQNLLFTDFQLFNKSVAAGDTMDGRVILTKSISQTHAITLKHQENVFAIEFAACNYFNPDKVDYQYMLQGFDKNWITAAANNRKVTYTNLDASDYVFKVRAKNINNPQSASMITLKITVLPPFWATGLAYFIYFVLVAGALLFIRNRGILKLKRQFEATQAKLEAERKIAGEREEARRVHRLDLMKIKFFTNISHEFRTPLTLILSPIDNLIKMAEKPEERQHLQTIKRNGRRLLNLVNQLLDFRKMEYNELKLSMSNGDLVQFIRDVFSSFNDIANQKQIQYHFESEVYALVTTFDQDKIERIFFNLLSNAFKFTPPGGHISVIISLAGPEKHIGGKKSIEIKVVDTGIGVSKENQERIFERFFQDDLPENLLNQGSGIGLSITREFVKMHKGTIEIDSETDYGTCFTITLPVAEQYDKHPADEPLLELPALPAPKTLEELPGTIRKPTILLIEDNDDLRFYLKDNLKNSFHIIEAANGKDGWQKALSHHPKLIVSDVNMPGMNGVELCRKIKADSRTSHLPVILLTALTAEQDQMAGLESGASDYVVKPFNFEILLSRIHNLLKMQQVLKDTYQKQVEIQAQDIAVVSEDEKFLKNALEYIEQNMANPNLSVESLSSHLNVSRGSLYKKLLALTGKTPVDCIRTIRLKRATQLLAKSQRCIANVAYDVGFNNPAYFAKVFREEYGMLPSEYINEVRSKEQEGVLV